MRLRERNTGTEVEFEMPEQVEKLTLVQIEELQQAWNEMMAEIGFFLVFNFCIAIHDESRKIVLLIEANGEEFIRTLKHSTAAQMDALSAFIFAGGCDDNDCGVIPETATGERTEFSVEELLASRRRRTQ